MSRTDNSAGAAPVEMPFADWPRMEVVNDGSAVHITGRYTAPSWWWSYGFPLVLALASLFVLPASCQVFMLPQYGGDLTRMPAGDAGYFLLFWVVAGFVLAVVAEHYGRKRTLDIKFSREAIVIGGKRYARGLAPLEFRLEEHEMAHAEEGSERRTGDRSRVYRDAHQVVMRYQERRIAIADFRRSDIRKAEALFLRLQFLNKNLEKLLGLSEEGEAVATPGDRDDFGKPPPIR